MKKNFIFFLLILFSGFIITSCSKKEPENGFLDDIGQKNNLEEKINLLEEQKTNFEIPSWAKEINITKPDGMQINKSLSYQTTKDLDGFNSIHFVYEGEYNNSLQQAEKMAQIAEVGLSKEFEMAQEIIKNMGDEGQTLLQELGGNLQGVIYTNYNLTKDPNSDYIISISVDENGTLELAVTDRKDMQNIVKDKVN